MKKTLFFITIYIAGITTATSQANLQTITDNGGNTTTNPISITPIITATTPNTVAPALTLMPTYNRIGPASVIADFTATGAQAGTYNNRTPVNTTGTGSGLIVSVTVNATLAATVSVTNPGTGYNVGDALTIPVTELGGTGTGVCSLYVGNVNSTGTYHVRHAALSFNSTIGGYSYTNAITPMFNATIRNRDNSQASSSQLQFGYFFKTAQNPYWAFSINGNYVMGIGSAIDMNILTAYNATCTNLNTSIINTTNGRVLTTGNSNASYIDNTTKFVGSNANVGSSFIANQTIVSGAVTSLTITAPGSGYTPGVYAVNATSAQGTGTGLVLSITVGQSGTVTNAGIGSNNNHYGSGYTQGQTVTASIPGGSGFAATVNLRTGHHFAALANYATFRSKTADNFYTIRSIPTINQEEGATGNVYGFYHNPTLTSLKGKHIAFENTTGDIYLGTTSGNVGIGTTNPQAKLAVKGNVMAQRVKVSVNPADWPDYVFDSTYRLLPLADLEAFIQKNNHLPEVPAAAVVGKEGLDLADNQALLLKKIEELTLYVIGQNKELQAQNERLKTLETNRRNKPAQ